LSLIFNEDTIHDLLGGKIMRNRNLILGVSIAVLAAGTALAQSGGAMSGVQPEGTEVRFCGTVVKLVEVGCIGVKPSMVGQPVYDLSGIGPKPHVGWMVTGAGYTGGMSHCMQGVHLATAMWKKVDVCALDK
jgi:hypothetical protein